MESDSTKRFSDRVNDYVKFRPSYPPAVLEILQSKLGLKRFHTVVDVGSGTGISSKIFLDNGNTVYGIEPNEKMRSAAEMYLKNYQNFRSVEGTSENTKLPTACADFIVAAQAFHWFSPIPTKIEFRRILKENGFVIVIFNDRKISGSGFSVQYEELLNEFGIDYKQVKHQNISEHRHREFLGPYEQFNFLNHQEFDFAGLLGRLKSSSYAPKQGHPRFQDMHNSLEKIFKQNQENGHVVMEYTTQVYCSQIK